MCRLFCAEFFYFSAFTFQSSSPINLMLLLVSCIYEKQFVVGLSENHEKIGITTSG